VVLVVGRVHDFQSLDEEVSRVAKDGLNEINQRFQKIKKSDEKSSSIAFSQECSASRGQSNINLTHPSGM
jgi:hypothetical protein